MLDYVLIAIIMVAVVFSAIKGFFNELRFLASVILGFYITYLVAPLITSSFVADGFSILASLVYIVMFVVLFVVIQILANFLIDNFESGDGINMLLGGVFGLLKGFGVVIVIAFISLWFADVKFFNQSSIRNYVVNNSLFVNFVKNVTGKQPESYKTIIQDTINQAKEDISNAVENAVENAVNEATTAVEEKAQQTVDEAKQQAVESVNKVVDTKANVEDNVAKPTQNASNPVVTEVKTANTGSTSTEQSNANTSNNANINNQVNTNSVPSSVQGQSTITSGNVDSNNANKSNVNESNVDEEQSTSNQEAKSIDIDTIAKTSNGNAGDVKVNKVPAVGATIPANQTSSTNLEQKDLSEVIKR